ncbi:MAG: YcxB family protein [Chthoniobacter sp.]|uniref:YcxB family protein n=1 Tax=Chthoniobacter sp. TaxID=2510640 RepID=UPI0032AB2FD7
MKLSYEFDHDDWISFHRYHYSVSPTYRRMRNYARIMFPVAALFLIGTHYLNRGFDPVHIGLFTAVSVAWFFLYPLWVDRRVIRRTNQFLREGDSSGMFGRREIELLPDTVHIATTKGETTYKAAAITKVVETADALLLYVSSLQAVILPRRKLSPEEFQQAVSFAQQYYVPPAA